MTWRDGRPLDHQVGMEEEVPGLREGVNKKRPMRGNQDSMIYLNGSVEYELRKWYQL